MKQLRLNLKTASVVCLAALAAGGTARAGHTVGSIPLAPHGDAIEYNSGALPLTPATLVTTARGDDDIKGTADDKLLIVTGVGSAPVITASVIGNFPSSGARWTRLSATRALYQTAGADGNWRTGDEELLIVDGIGSTNTVTRLVVGSLQDSQGGMHVPERLTADTVVIPVLGADNTASTADDAVALVTNIGGTPTVTPLPAPFLRIGGRTTPVAMSPTSFLIASSGPDGKADWDTTGNGADDVIYLFTDVGGANTRTSIPVPHLHSAQPGRPVRVSSTLAVVTSFGPDGDDETADDRVFVLRELGGTPTVASLEVPGLACCGAARPRVLGTDLVALPTWGVDVVEGNADDTLAFISSLGGTLVASHVVVGGMEEDRESRPVRLSGNSVAVATRGPDFTRDTAADTLVVVSDVGGADTVTSVNVPGISDGGGTEPIALSAGTVLLLSGGPDGSSDSGNDDVYTVVTGLGTATLVAESTPLGATGGAPLNSFGLASRPAYAGGGRAIAMGTGPDGAAGAGDDDVVHVIDDLPGGDDLTVKKLQINFKAAKPEKGEKFSVKADLLLEDPTMFGMGDLTISIGNAAQTIAADAFVEKRGKPTYKRPKGGAGFIKKVVYNPKRGTLTVTGKGVGTGGETTAAEFIPFSLDITDGLFVAETFAGEAKKSGLKYKRSK